MKQLTISLPSTEDSAWVIAVLHEIGGRYEGQYGLCQRPEAIEFVHEDPDAIEQARRRVSTEGLAEEERLAVPH